ncbi:hypothetical protein SSX86_012672 [Deinandra increscens subsp. villosa]|uniref:F-box domain-containing protein n=1 Tax=Deinandra increscens subsp. villosa TaxID=3103831 RepID=A0AAP0D960_9ASTR
MSPATIQPPPTTTTTTGISSLPTHILQSHILTQLDPRSLASAACSSTSLSAAAHHHHLWSTLSHSTWPSTATPQITQIISDHRSFFSHSFPLPSPDPTTTPPPQIPTSPPPSPPVTELISAVDIHYRNKPIFTKTEVTETTTNWFRCSPFRIDMLDPKNTVATHIPHDATCPALMEDVALSWILIDAVNKRSVNLSSVKPVSVHRHWLSGEVQARFASVLAGESGAAVECRVVVNCGGSEDGRMRLREVMMEMEDMDGNSLKGRGSLVILQRVMEGKRGNGVNREEEGRRRFRRYEEMKRERRDMKSRVEGTLDVLSLVFGLFVFVVLFSILILKTLR